MFKRLFVRVFFVRRIYDYYGRNRLSNIFVSQECISKHGRLDNITTLYILCSMNTVISVKIDKDVKESAQEVAKSAGLTLSTLVNAYLRQVAATRRIELYAPEQMTPHLEKLVAAVEKNIQAGNVSQPFDNIDDFIADLKS